MAKSNIYDVHYWIYAFLHRKFGNDLTIQRDSCHRRYEVNRHSFTVYPNHTTIRDIKNELMVQFYDWASNCDFTRFEKDVFVPSQYINRKFTIIVRYHHNCVEIGVYMTSLKEKNEI